MRSVRSIALAALVALAAAPVPRVYTATAPMVDKLVVRHNDLLSLEGHGVPGTFLTVRYRQRNFIEGSTGDAANAFQWCAWKNGGNALPLGSAVVDSYGRWQLGGTDLQILPSYPDGSACGGGLKTELLVESAYGDAWAPEGHWLNLRRPTTNTATVSGQIEYAHRAAALVADGPDDGDTPFNPDVDEDGIDLCAAGLCNARVSWKCGNGGTWQCPQTTVQDGSGILANDREYPFVVGLISAHKPGGTLVMAAELNRPALGPTFNVNVDIKGLDKLNICDGSGKFFDFLG